MARDRHLQHTKGLRTTTGRGAPSPNEGSDGDMTIRSLGTGLFLFVKFGNFWYHVSELVSYNPKKVHPNKIKPVNILPGGVQGGGGSKDIGITAGSKLILSSINTREGISGNNYIQSGTTQTSSDLGNTFARDFMNITVGDRALLTLDENGSGSRIIAGTDSQKSIIEGYKFVLSDSYGSTPGDTHITGSGDDELTITVGGQAMLKFIESTTNTMESEEIAEYLIRSGTTADPVLHLKNTTNDATSPTLKFTNERSGGGNVGANNDRAGIIEFYAEDDAGNSTNVGTISSSISDVTDGSEDGYVAIEALGGTTSEIRLDSGGVVNLDAANTNDTFGVQFSLNGTMVGNITGHHAKTYFTLYENIGASTSDKFYIGCGANGATDIGTQDGAGTAADLTIVPDGSLSLEPSASLTLKSSVHQLEQASADADQAGYGQLWTKNATPNELYFTNDAGNDIQITSGSSMAGGGGGTDTWETTVGGYKTNNNSSTYYYTQYYSGYHTWTRSDTTPTSIDDYAVYTSVFTAQKDGTLTSIKFMGRASDTGVTDPFKVYVYKAAPAHGDTTTTATLIGTSSTITPGGTLRNVVSTTAISSSNSFSAGDSLYVWYKKDSTSGSQDLYFQISISGEYD